MPKQKSYIGIKNESDSSVLELHFTDYIYDGFDWNTWEEVNLVQDTINAIKAANPSTIKIYINSLGGDVMIGLALYNYLKAHKAEKEVDVFGFAASIASIMAMCASKGKLRMAKSSFMIIHAAWSHAVGNAKEMRDHADNLEKVSNELASIYALRSGKEAKYFTDLWNNGDHWMTGDEAHAIGLADVVYNSEPIKAKVNVAEFGFKNIPAGLMNASAGDDPKNFISIIKNEFMKLTDSLKNLVKASKEDPKNKIENKDAILEMIENVLTPFAEKIDAAIDGIKPKAETEEKPAEEKPAETKPAETKPAAEEKPAEEKPAEEKPAEEKPKDDVAELKAQVEKLTKSLANMATKPGTGATGDKVEDAASKVDIQY